MTLHIDITKWSIPQSYCIYSAAQDGESLYSQQKQDLELTVAQIMRSILQKKKESESRSVVSDSLGAHGL